MRITYKKDLLSPIRDADASTVIIYDKHGHPISIVEELLDGLVVITSAGEENFDNRIRLSGMCTETPPVCKRV